MMPEWPSIWVEEHKDIHHNHLKMTENPLQDSTLTQS